MKRTLMTLAAAAAIATAGTAATTQPANAAAWWVAPAIVGGVLVGGIVAATAAQNSYGYNSYGYYQPRGNVYVRPAHSMSNCYTAHEQTRRGWRSVRVCE